MWCLKICLVIFVLLHSQNGSTFDGFSMRGEAFDRRKKEAEWLDGVSMECNTTVRSLDSDARWLYFDSWGKPGSGILSGNVKWFGAFDQCIGIPHGKYCLVTMLGKFRTNTTLAIWYGICVPDACDATDISILLENFANNVSHHFFPSVRVLDLSCYKEQSYTTAVVFTIIFCCIILACCVIGTLIEAYEESCSQNGRECDFLTKQNDIPKQDTSFDHEIPKITDVTETTPLIKANRKQNGLILKSEQQIDTRPITEYSKNDGKKLKLNSFVVKFCLCFSLLRNSRAVFKTDATPGTVTSLFGLRVLSILWVILGHVYVYSRHLDGITVNVRDLRLQTENFSNMVITNAFPAVDTFFFLSGLLLMYNVMNRLQNSNGEIHWGKFYLHRFLRLTPALMFVILFIVQLEPFLDKGPLWQQHLDRETCDDYWWTNLLYINNFYPTNVARDSTRTTMTMSMQYRLDFYIFASCVANFVSATMFPECMQWTWYLAVDMQFFVISPVIIYIFYRYGYHGVIATSLFLGIVSIICLAVITEHFNIHPMSIPMPNASLSDIMNTFNYLYVKPYCRIHPYLIGLVFGYLMHRRAFRAKQLYWPLAVIFWFLSAVAAFSLIYGPFTAMRADPRPWTMFEKIFYSTAKHLVWGIVVAWVTYACEYGYGRYVYEFLSAKFWVPLGRLTYCTYLVHCQVLEVMLHGYRSGLYFSTQWWAYIYCGTLLLSHGIAFILVVTVEYPCANLDKLLFGRKNRKHK